MQMSNDTSKTNVPLPANFTIRQGNKDIQVSYQQLFEQGHNLWLRKKYPDATKIFELLCKTTDRGPRADILLAHCYVMQEKFALCSATLCKALPEAEFGSAAGELHDTFIFWRCGVFNDVKTQLIAIVNKFSNLSTTSLLLADFFIKSGNYKDAQQALRLAISRDRPDGAIAFVAKHLSAVISNQEQSKRA